MRNYYDNFNRQDKQYITLINEDYWNGLLYGKDAENDRFIAWDEDDAYLINVEEDTKTILGNVEITTCDGFIIRR